MRIAPPLATAIVALALPALAAPALTFPALASPALAAPFFSAAVTPDVVRQLKEMADASFKASTPAPKKKTPEQVEAEKKATQAHCEALFARVTERGVKVPGGC